MKRMNKESILRPEPGPRPCDAGPARRRFPPRSPSMKNEKMESAMAGQPNCDECAAIARELAEARAEAWASLDPPAREAATAFCKMIDGPEEDAARAEELLDGARIPSTNGRAQATQQRVARELFGYSPIRGSGPDSHVLRVLRRALTHLLQTGHWVALSGR